MRVAKAHRSHAGTIDFNARTLRSMRSMCATPRAKLRNRDFSIQSASSVRPVRGPSSVVRGPWSVVRCMRVVDRLSGQLDIQSARQEPTRRALRQSAYALVSAPARRLRSMEFTLN
jgi:hypothetical protein